MAAQCTPAKRQYYANRDSCPAAEKAEIVENDYNLNIPRYVDTFEEEAPVDLDAVQAELAQVETELAAAQAKMAVYLKELGL